MEKILTAPARPENRQEMRGHIRRRRKSWAVVVEWDPETGSRQEKGITVRRTKKEAEKVLAETLAKLGRGELASSSKMTLGHVLPDMQAKSVKAVQRCLQMFARRVEKAWQIKGLRAE
jgi:hypothetical protein